MWQPVPCITLCAAGRWCGGVIVRVTYGNIWRRVRGLGRHHVIRGNVQWPHGRNGEGNWEIALRQILQEVRAICKTRNQLLVCIREETAGERTLLSAAAVEHARKVI